MKAKHLIFLIAALALYIPMQAQYDGLIVKMDYFDPNSPKFQKHVEMFYDIFSERYLLSVSTTKTTFSKGSTNTVGAVAKTKHYYRSKTITDTVVSLTKEDFNEFAGDCFKAVSKLITEKMRTTDSEFVGWAGPTLDLSIENGTVKMEFSFECPICPQDNCYEEQFYDILARILAQAGLDSGKLLGSCE